jgi:hypothetical protein
MAAIVLGALGALAAELPEVRLEAPRGALRIAVAGDTGSGSESLAKAIAAAHAAQPLDAIILTGDNFYPCGVTSATDPRWDLVRPLTAIGIPILPVLGNHDFCGDADPQAQIAATGSIPRWTFPAREYAVSTPFADFAMLDTTPFVFHRAAAPEQTIREALGGSAKPWQIVVGHHTIVSSGWHGYFPRDDVRRMRELLPTMLDAGTDLYICGHDHHVELIRGKVLYLVSGAGSDPIPPVSLHARTLFPPEVRRERVGFAVLELSATELAIRFYDERGKPKSERFRFAASARTTT